MVAGSSSCSMRGPRRLDADARGYIARASTGPSACSADRGPAGLLASRQPGAGPVGRRFRRRPGSALPTWPPASGQRARSLTAICPPSSRRRSTRPAVSEPRGQRNQVPWGAAPRIHVAAPRRRVWCSRSKTTHRHRPIQERIFTIFQRLHSRRTTRHRHRLAICKRIVERHGGRICVTPPPEGGDVLV